MRADARAPGITCARDVWIQRDSWFGRDSEHIMVLLTNNRSM